MLDSGTVSLSCSSASGNQRPLPTPYVTQVAFGDAGTASPLNMGGGKKKVKNSITKWEHSRLKVFDRVAF